MYLQRFRNEGIFYEAVTNRIMDDFIAAVQPRRATVESRWTPRGGLNSHIIVKYPDEG
jgi:7-cyano-7-deazaguanine reductase